MHGTVDFSYDSVLDAYNIDMEDDNSKVYLVGNKFTGDEQHSITKETTFTTSAYVDWQGNVYSGSNRKIYLTDHQNVTNENATLEYDTTSTIAKVGSTNITVTMPQKPVTEKVLYEHKIFLVEVYKEGNEEDTADYNYYTRDPNYPSDQSTYVEHFNYKRIGGYYQFIEFPVFFTNEKEKIIKNFDMENIELKNNTYRLKRCYSASKF